MPEKDDLSDASALLDPRYYFGHYTPDRGCGGTDGDVYLKLLGSGAEYPGPGRWYVLDNSGNDRERGDWDSYWIESGSMRSVHTCRLYFVPKGGAPAWELAACSLNKMKKDPLTGRWQVAAFLNRWEYNVCLRQEGWYTRVDTDFRSASRFAAANDLFAKDPETFNSVIAMSTLSDQQDVMRITDNRPTIALIPEAIDMALSPEDAR